MACSLAAQSLLRNINEGNSQMVSNLVGNGVINLDERDEDGQTFLMIASQLGDVEIVKLLIDSPNVDVNAVDNDNWTALLNASKEGHVEVVEVLLDAGSSVEHRDIGGWTALMWACYKGWTSVVDVLLRQNANPNVREEHNISCLTWASGRGHTDIVKLLLSYDVRVNTADKFGSTALIWAARKGHTQIVELLLLGGATAENSGMNSWTALTMAAKGGYVACLKAILHCSPNVNAVDKDGLTPLAHAVKKGSVEIVDLLLQKGGYVNLPDKNGDTILIHAGKGGHLEVTKSLLRKYADIDVQGVDHKTALYWAVEKGHPMVVRVLLEHNANTEIATKEGDVPLMKAVRSRNFDNVKHLLDKGAKSNHTDKKGDTALHIAVRGRSKKICEYLLRNPKDHRLLYRPNKVGETPYQIDGMSDKSILTQVFGSRNLNKVEKVEGYDIYSSTIADVLSIPSLTTPITLGLYAKWGSGKSMLISRLISEMKTFTKHNDEPYFELTFAQGVISFLIAATIGIILGLATEWYIGLGVGGGLLLLMYALLALVLLGARKREWRWALEMSFYMARKLRFLSLLLKVVFCNHPEKASEDSAAVKFCFTDNTRLATVVGEKSITAMVATLYESLEHEYGTLATRLYQVFKPKKQSEHGRFKTVCCFPYFLIFLFVCALIVSAAGLMIKYGIHSLLESPKYTIIDSILVAHGIIIAIAFLGSILTWGRCLYCLIMPGKRRVWKITQNVESLKMEGFMQNLKKEVQLMAEMVNCLDAFLGHHSRLVVIVDCLDSCEQEKLLQVLDIVQMLFGEQNSPFITILAIDPHVIIKGIQNQIAGPFHNSTINGYDYLCNIVQLPFFLQSQALPEVARGRFERSDSTACDTPKHKKCDLASSSHLSLTESKSRLKQKDSMGSSKNILGGSNPRHMMQSNLDLSKTLEGSSYFSDVNPKNMRRLMNIVAVTNRLLRAYHLDFNWYKLLLWVNLTEHWPYRLSWIILHVEDNSDEIEDQVPLKKVYARIVNKVPNSRDVEIFVEIDRDPRKLQVFLSSQPLLTVGDMRLFMACTINVDPYLRKVIREYQQAVEHQEKEFSMLHHAQSFPVVQEAASGSTLQRRKRRANATPLVDPSPRATPTRPMSSSLLRPAPMGYANPLMMSPDVLQQQLQLYSGMHAHMTQQPQPSPRVRVQGGMPSESLNEMSVADVGVLLGRLEGISQPSVPAYIERLKINNISGLVLLHCDIQELKPVMQMTFGDWELFRACLEALRAKEMFWEGARKQDVIRECDSSSPEVASPREFTQKAPTFDRNVEAPAAKYPASELSRAGSRSSRKSSPEKLIVDAPDGALKKRRSDSIFGEAMKETEVLREMVIASGVDEESYVTSEEELAVIEEAAAPPEEVKPKPIKKVSTSERLNRLDYEKPKKKIYNGSDSDSEDTLLYEKPNIPEIKFYKEHPNHTLESSNSSEIDELKQKSHLSAKTLFRKIKNSLSGENINNEAESLLTGPESTTSSRPVSQGQPSSPENLTPTSSHEHLPLRNLSHSGQSAFQAVSPQSSAASSRRSSRAFSFSSAGLSVLSRENSVEGVSLHISEGEDGEIMLRPNGPRQLSSNLNDEECALLGTERNV